MIEHDELKNAASFLDNGYCNFDNLSLKQIKQDICDALFIINHLVDMNAPKQDAKESTLEPGELIKTLIKEIDPKGEIGHNCNVALCIVVGDKYHKLTLGDLQQSVL